MTKISNFGKQNSTLGSVVPLAMFKSYNQVREISEGRMRAEARGGVGPMSVPSEGRLRVSAQVQSSMHHTWKFCSKAHFLFP